MKRSARSLGGYKCQNIGELNQLTGRKLNISQALKKTKPRCDDFISRNSAGNNIRIRAETPAIQF